MGLHADESMFHKRLPNVVQLSSISPIEIHQLLHTELTYTMYMIYNVCACEYMSPT